MKPEVKQKLIDFLNERIIIDEFGNSAGIKICCWNNFHPHTDHYSVDAIVSELYMKEHGLDWEKDEWKHYERNGSRFLCMGHSHGMPREVMAWAGIGFIDHLFYGISEKQKEVLFERINAL